MNDFENKLFLGIDTSNYTTSVAISDFNGNIVLNLKKLLPVAEGERGLRQSDALFAHTKNIPELMEELKNFLKEKYSSFEIAAIGYSKTPRDAKDSYMPCFLSGISVAEAISAVTGAESYAFSHQAGHVMAALYSSGQTSLLNGNKEFAAFHVSGGTTDILLVNPCENRFLIEQIGESEDINAGQAIDRAGVLMGLGFPCGKEMEALCADKNIDTPKPKISVKGLNCNFSGLENLAKKLYLESGDKALVSLYCFDFVGQTLKKLTENLREKYCQIPIIYAGGVMSNKRIKAVLSTFKDTFFAEPEFSSDNASGVALLCRNKYLNKYNGEI